MLSVLMLGGISLRRANLPEKTGRRRTLLFVLLITTTSLVAGCLHSSNSPDPSKRLVMTAEDPSDLNYRDGKTYTASITVKRAEAGITDYTFRFCDLPNCSGVNANATGAPTQRNQLVIN